MRIRKTTSGFTLIELLMVIVIMGVISVVIGRILFQSLQTFATAQNISDNDWQGLLSLNVFSNDVHNIRSANDITSISASSFSFVDMAGNAVTYQLSGSALLRNGATLATNVNSIAFTYLDKNYATTATPANVRYITFAVSATKNTLSLSYSTMAGTRGMP